MSDSNGVGRPSSPASSPLAWLRRPRNTLAVGLVAAGVVAAVVATSSSQSDPSEGTSAAPPSAWTGKVIKVSRAGGDGGLEICDAAGAACQPAAAGAILPAGALLRTDDRTRAQLALDDGSKLVLDRATELALLANQPRHGKVSKGAIVAEIAKTDGVARIDLPQGYLQVLGTKLALHVSEQMVAVDVSRGSVKLVDAQQREVTVRAGEEGRAYSGSAPYAVAAPSLGEALSWSDEEQGEEVSARGLGELRAKKPGSDEEKEGAVVLTSHKVKVRIVDGFARTEVEEVFSNTTDEVLEGIYRFPLPADGHIEGLKLEVDDHFEEGAFVDRERAAAIWRGAIVNSQRKRPRPREEIIWVPGPWKDPALLEWQRGGRFELRIFPIPKKGSRRVVLTYTQVVKPAAGVRRYIYPLPHDPSGSTRVGDFAVDVQVRGHDPELGVSTRGYAMSRNQAGAVEQLALQAADFVPSGDLVIEYALPGRGNELTAWTYQPHKTAADSADPSAEPAQPSGQAKAASADAAGVGKDDSASDDNAAYLALALRPRLPRWTEDAQRAYVLVVDASRSMVGERFRRASAVATRLVQELDRLDRFTVMICDSSCRAMPGGLQAPSSQAAQEVKEHLATVSPEGGSDVTANIRDAAALVGSAEGRALRIVYIGDGTPTIGPIRPGSITRAVRKTMPYERGTVTAVAIGADADLDALAALARGGGGALLPYAPGQRTGEVALAILGASYGTGLRDVSVELPDGLTAVAPRVLDTMVAGSETLIVARMRDASLKGEVVLRGKVGSKDFEKRYPLEVSSGGDGANAFLPRLYAAARIADLEHEGTAAARVRAVALSSRFNVASRHTSLLVLESPAMFKAFGLDNTRSAPVWTGEEDTDKTEVAGGEGDMAPDEEAAASAWGPGGGGMPAKPPPGAMPKARPSRRGQASCPSDDLMCVMRAAADDPVAAARAGGQAFVPMRRVWERTGSISSTQLIPLLASAEKIAEAEAKLAGDENRRASVKSLYTLYALAGQLDKAGKLAEHWSNKEALDPEALTARADLAARRGDRELAIRMLGSVVDVRPGDVPSQRRLARLHRWAGRPEIGCRHSIAIAELRPNDGKLLAEAVHCMRATGQAPGASDMLDAADDKTRKLAETELKKLDERKDTLRGEVRLTATWQGDSDLDLSLIHPDGYRVSWLGAPTKALITAEDVTSKEREGLALLGSKAGEYALEVVRGAGEGAVHGELTVRAAGVTRKIPFALDASSARLTLGTVRIRWQSRLVPHR